MAVVINYRTRSHKIMADVLKPELGTRYFKSNGDIGTDTFLKKYRRYR